MFTKERCKKHGKEAKWFCVCAALDAVSMCDECLTEHNTSQHAFLAEQVYFEMPHFKLFQSFSFDVGKFTQRLQRHAQVSKLLEELDQKENEAQLEANRALQELSRLAPQWLEEIHRDYQAAVATLRRETDLLLRSAVCEESSVTKMLFSKPEAANADQLLQLPEISLLTSLAARLKYSACTINFHARLSEFYLLNNEPADPLASSISPAANLALSSLPRLAQNEGVSVWKALTQNADGLYAGSWDVKDRRHGTGRQVFRNRSVFEGQWRDDKQNGWGRLVEADGGVYEGLWKDNLRHGFGTETMSSGSTYCGQFHLGVREGFGTFTYGSATQWKGDVYCGWFRNGQFHGRGAYWWADGGLFVGEWSAHKKHGRGLIYSARGRIYYGDWIDGQPHGVGCDVNISGRQLCAEFSGGKMIERIPSPC